jgi:hypothetical protein
MSDSGDIILEAQLPWEVTHGEKAARTFTDRLNTSTAHIMEQRVLQVRLAFLLAWKAEEAPVLLPVWRRYIEPLKQGDSIGWSPPDRYRPRSPARLDQRFCDAWREWSMRLDAGALSRLGVAPQRLIRASAERAAPDDRLIDAVIAWEALFGSESEATLRVTGSLAKILHSDRTKRLDTERKARQIYHLRSRLVHGALGVNVEDMDQPGREAVRLATEVLRVLIAERPDLLEMDSIERSRVLLVG